MMDRVKVMKVSYAYVLNTLLQDELFTDFGKVILHLRDVVTKRPGDTVSL